MQLGVNLSRYKKEKGKEKKKEPRSYIK